MSDQESWGSARCKPIGDVSIGENIIRAKRAGFSQLLINQNESIGDYVRAL
jgi:hypothetical protein